MLVLHYHAYFIRAASSLSRRRVHLLTKLVFLTSEPLRRAGSRKINLTHVVQYFCYRSGFVASSESAVIYRSNSCRPVREDATPDVALIMKGNHMRIFGIIIKFLMFLISILMFPAPEDDQDFSFLIFSCKAPLFMLRAFCCSNFSGCTLAAA